MDVADDEVEEELVYIKFDSLFDKELFNPDVNFKLIGLEKDEPVVQLGAQVFTGKWEMAAGTCTFFEEDPDHKTEDPIFNPSSKTNVKYTCKTRKILHMHRTVLKKKSDEKSDQVLGENIIEGGGSIEIEEKETEEPADTKDVLETDLDLSLDDIERLALDPSEVDPAIIDAIMET